MLIEVADGIHTERLSDKAYIEVGLDSVVGHNLGPYKDSIAVSSNKLVHDLRFVKAEQNALYR